jgi:26S proteasome regulatory subunit T1
LTEYLYSYVPVHLEYILTEILKNSFRATVERYYKLQKAGEDIPSVVVTIVPPPDLPHDSGDSKFLIMRVRDQGGGVSPSHMARIFSYAFTTAERGLEDEDGRGYVDQHTSGDTTLDLSCFSEITRKGNHPGLGKSAGLGYGLPMSRLYAR